MFSRPALIAIVAAAVATGLGLDWWFDPSNRLDRAVAALSKAPRAARFATGRLSIDHRWAAGPDVTRGSSAARPSLETMEAALSIERLTPAAADRRALHARALATLASGNTDGAIDDLRRALGASTGAAAPVRADLAAVLLDRGRRHDEPTDIVDALDEAGLALSESVGMPAALFNQALALETLGPRSLAAAAWEQYLAADGSSEWAGEARLRLAALRARPVDSHMETTRRFHELERELLPAWARRTLAGESADTHPLTAAIDALAPRTRDREVIGLARAAVAAASGPPDERSCVARAVASLDGWLEAYNRTAAEEAQTHALDAERALDCAGLPVTGARVRAALAGDRNAVYESLGTLAADAAGRDYFRIASLARIARGNSAMRRAELTTGMGDLQRARALAHDAGDLELTATADAMMADGYRELGDQSSAWRSLQLALDNLPAAVNLRLVYSIIRAAAAAALDEGHSAASLPYSKLLIDATRGWRQPAARILANLDRARALQRTGLSAQATAAVDVAAALVPQVEDPATKGEFVAEIALARGRLAVASAPASAIPLLSDAFAFFREHRTSVRMASVLLERGRAYRALGDLRAARADFDQAASLIEDQQPDVREAQLRVSRFSALWDAFAELERSDKTDAAASLGSSERARARELLDSLAPDQKSAPLAGPALWNWLPGDVTAVVYSVLPEETLVWIVDRNGPRLREIRIGADAIDALVRRAVKEIGEGRADGLNEISTLLLRDLPQGRPESTLLIVPDGPLHFLPFPALTVPGTGSRLVERWTPVVAPSLSVAHSLAAREQPARPAARALLVGYAGAGEAGLPRLRGVPRELEALKTVYPQADAIEGAAATPGAFLRLAPASTVIHVAAHGVVNLAYPSRSYLLLAPEPEIGALSPSRIASARLLASPVVVLSACDTAAGRVYRGEGAMSLARAFLVAGASSVIAAQYAVQDNEAPSLQASLHALLSAGAAGADALARAQRDAIGSGMNVRDWAVFSAIGSLQVKR